MVMSSASLRTKRCSSQPAAGQRGRERTGRSLSVGYRTAAAIIALRQRAILHHSTAVSAPVALLRRLWHITPRMRSARLANGRDAARLRGGDARHIINMSRSAVKCLHGAKSVCERRSVVARPFRATVSPRRAATPAPLTYQPGPAAGGRDVRRPNITALHVICQHLHAQLRSTTAADHLHTTAAASSCSNRLRGATLTSIQRHLHLHLYSHIIALLQRRSAKSLMQPQ